ncbi:MAG TPA: phosphoribosylanthranilate isomerase [Acidimicrobiales bacterium]|nr:phosphoribosylanthranilate isomerase [Acidimicrobiales bacterium]
MFVKICGITTEADALLAVALGADGIGFVFSPSPRQMSAQAARRIADRVPPEILTVGVFRNEAPARVVEIVNSIGLRAAQLHGDESVEDTRWVSERVPLTIKAFPAGHPGIGRIDDYRVGYVLVDAESPGSGEVFDWRLAEGVVDPARLIVSGGLRPDNVADAVAHLAPYGVDVSSGVESAPGRKDPVKVRAFVAAARAAAGEDVERAGSDGEGPGDGDGDGSDGPGERIFDWREQGG